MLAVASALTAGAQDQSGKIIALKGQVQSKLISNNIDSAKLLSQQLIQQAPTAQNYLLAGSVSEKANDRVTADKLYQQALAVATDSDKYKIVSTLGYISLNRGDTTTAINYQYQSLTLNSAQHIPHYFLSVMYKNKNKPDSAEYHGIAAYKLDSVNLNYIRLMANAEYSKGDLSSSIRYLKRLHDVRKLSADADSNKAKDALANFYMKIDDYTNALPLLKELIVDSVKNDVYYYDISKCYYNLNNAQAALQNALKAIAVSPIVKQEYYDMLINIYQALGQQINAVQAYVTGKGNGIQGYATWLAQYQLAVTQAQTINTRLQQEDREKQRGDLFLLAKLYLFAKDDNNAINVLNDYKQLQGEATDSVHMIYSTAYAGLNRLAEAKKSILLAIKMSPTNQDYKYMLLSVIYRQKDYRGVIDLIEKEDKNNNLVDVDMKNNLLFKCYTILGETQNAIKYKPAAE